MTQLRLYLIGGLVAAVLLFGALWLREHDQRLEERAAARARIERDSASLVVARDSMRLAGAALQSSMHSVRDALELYDSARKTVRTVTLTRTLPGRTDTLAVVDTVKVPVTFIEAADSLRKQCTAVANDCARFRIHADSVITTQARMIDELKVIGTPKRSSLLSQVGRFALVFGAGYLTGVVTR